MPSRELPGQLGIMGDWDLGEGGWKDSVDLAMILASVLLGRRVDQLVAALPGTPAEGDIVLLDETAGTDANKLAVYDEATWKTFPLPVGVELFDEAAGVVRRFDGTTWAAVPEAVWGGITGSIADQSDLTAAIAAAGGNTGGSQQLTGIVSGLGVSYTGDLDFSMAAGSFFLDSELVTAAAQSITLDGADATHSRIDVLYVDSSGTLGKITGTPSASPSQPSVDPTTQLFLTFVLVPATATSLGGISNVDIYREGTEWTPTASGSGFTIDSTSTPYAGTKCIEGTSVTAGSYAKMVAAAPVSFDGDGNLTLRIRSKATWNAKRWLTLQWYLGGVATGSQISLKSGSFGFTSSDTSAYQLVVINKALFQVPAGATVDELRIADVGGAIGFFIDDVILQTTGDTTGGSGQVTGITQTDADARYARRSQNLGDLTDVAAARTTLDVYSKAEVDAAVAGGGGGGGLSDGDYGDVTVSGTGTSILVKSGVLDVANFAGSAIVTEGEGLASSDNDTSIPTTAAVVDYIANAVAGLLDLKGDSDCSANPNYPAASKGDVYYVTVAGKIGGASGKSVDVGDAYIAKADNAGGTEASVGSNWFVLEHNLVSALTGSLASTTEVLTGTDTAKLVTPDGLAALWEKGSDIASAATISVGEGGLFHVTGTTTITDIDPAIDKAGRRFTLVFDGALTLTHNGTTLILPGGANITTAAGDSATFVSEGSDVVRCVGYQRASGRGPSIQSVASSATVTPTFENDQVNITAQAAGLTLANPTGTAVDGWGIAIRIKDNGTARSIAYGTQYRAIGVTLPTTTVVSKTLYLGMIYNAADTKWDVVAVAQEA